MEPEFVQLRLHYHFAADRDHVFDEELQFIYVSSLSILSAQIYNNFRNLEWN